MADKRYNPATSFVGGGYSAGPHMQPTQGVPGMVPYMQAGMPINNMMQQQMMMAPGLRFPIQGMRMGPPNTPPPPYSAHNTTAAMPTRPRASLNKAKEGGQQSEKERFFEEQRRKLQQFGRPGSVKVDEGKLIGSIFSADTKMATSKGKAAATQSADDDDGFGDFLQGPSLQQSAVKKEERKVTHESVEVIAPGPETKPQEEKKDLASIMLEYSDLSAPKKAKGFHKPTLNEVQKSGHIDTHRLKGSSFHESDHARSWKMQAEDLEGLFQLPAKAKKSPPAPLPTHSPQLVHAAVPAGAVIPPGEHVIAFGTGSTVMSPPLGPPPSYSEVVSPTALASPTNFMTTNHVSPAFSQPFTGSHSTNHVSPAVGQPFSGSHIANHVGPAVSQPFTTGHTNRSLTLPEWCTHNEEQMPPVYKHVWEASLVDNKISTERLYPILLLSGLPREKLAHIWSLCNTATPGQLVKHELWLILAMIALTQHQYNTNTMDILVECPVAPVPALATAQDTGPPATLPTTPMQHQVYTAHTPAATVPPVAGVVQMSPPNNVHRVQQPRPQLVTPAARGHSTLAPEDDDFTDFQAAIPAMSSVGKGHTSPSFEDDDFTDGRDSLSQVSTSEQSENDDLRNFESYVEEFQQKKEVPDGSPLHCPFPAFQKNPTVKATKGVKSVGKAGGLSAFHKPPSSQLPAGTDSTVFSAINHTVPKLPDLTTPAVSSKVSSAIPNNNTDDEFADFKSASAVLFPAASDPPSTEGPLIGDEDKYGALRVLTLSQPSLFEQPAPPDAQSSTNNEAVAIDEEEEWADFSAAAPTTDHSIGSAAPTTDHSIGSASPTIVSSKEPGKASSKKEDILKLFSVSAASKSPVTFSCGNSDVTSEGGSKNGSLFGDDISTTSTPSKSRGLDTQSLGDQLSSSSFSEQESTIGWVHESSGVDSHWASFGASDSYEPPGFTASPNDSQVNKLSSSGTAVTAGMFDTTLTSSLPGVVPNTSSRWDVLPQSPSLSSTSSHGYTNPQNIDPPGGFSSQTGQEDEWSSFSSAQAKAGAADEEGDLSGEAKFVTIKKQNLGTSEIMGVFKVRDDPATLSSYQLPPQASVNKNMARNTHHPPGAGHGYRMPSDDDMGPPPLDFSHDEDEDEHTFSRGYDFDDVIHQGPPATIYSPFGLSHSSPLYSHAGANRKLKENREDSGSVHSLDLPSNKQSDHYGSDSVSLSSTDLNGSEINGGGTGVVSAESKSLDSLDLKNDAADSEHSYSAKDDVQASSTHHPIQPQELLSSMPDFADKYNIQHEAQGSDRYGHYWEHCLSNCCRVIAEANTLFNTISSSSVCNEVLKSSQGSGYVTSVVEIYRVVCRIMTSMRSTAISTSELEQTVKDIDLAWNNLTAFLVGASLLPEQSTLVFSNCVLKSDSDHAKQLACGVCLLNVDTNPFNSGAGINSCKLTYAGRQYHATCANFWVNCVDQTLPSLTLPELL
ncbi:synergin gamma-like isoform X2 [Physella acuta]|uniref:synergin gamma-like isoform X2 n=1 Tax=Physella acuta TaxID=109671 RepID=UPI0027DD18C6|nr:synergin gamma-like isoform X2 [Physella acuta]